jgi:hypothetical protein
MSDDDRLAMLEKRVERLEKVVSQLVEEARAKQNAGKEGMRQPNPTDRRTVTEKVVFDWQGEYRSPQ